MSRSLRIYPAPAAETRLISRGRVLPNAIVSGAALSAVGVLALAAALRLPALADVGFSSDEAVYAGQGAALVGLEPYPELFSLFRAHPLLLQGIVGIIFQAVGVSDLAARLVVALLFGMGTVVATYLLGRELYGRQVGGLAALIVAVLPYHALLSRQVMVDTGMAFFTTLALWALAFAVRTSSGWWLALAAATAGAAALTKEIAVLMVPAVLAYLATTGHWRVFGLRSYVLATFAYVLTVAPFVVSRLLGPQSNASDVVLWQISRPPNHDPDYFLRVSLQFIGPALLALGAVGAARALARRTPPDLLLLAPMATLLAFFQVWPTKLFPYLMPLVPLLAIAASVGSLWLIRVSRQAPLGRRLHPGPIVLAGILLLSAGTAWGTVRASPERPDGFAALDVELQDFAGAREAAVWALTHTPANAHFLTIGPSLGNILRFYGHRDSVALSVSPDPRRRNPAYVPVPNPDLALRDSAIHYLVWDAYSADRSAFYNTRLLRYARKYAGQIVFSAYIGPTGEMISSAGPAPSGADVRVVIYSTAGGNPQPTPQNPEDS
ncbi:MAG: ArnT family glycosyltransferase [Candidatus Limnocylindria bacterium]